MRHKHTTNSLGNGILHKHAGGDQPHGHSTGPLQTYDKFSWSLEGLVQTSVHVVADNESEARARAVMKFKPRKVIAVESVHRLSGSDWRAIVTLDRNAS